MVVCLTSARFNMKADILRASGPVFNPDPADPDDEEKGTWTSVQDPDSGEIIRKWVPAGDNPDTPGEVEDNVLDSFKCVARGIVDGGIRVAGTTERFSEVYEGVDYVKIWFPAKVEISRRDRITNIRTKGGQILWREEERADRAPTVFSVVGVTPIIDPFGKHVENTALLERVEAQ